MLPTGTVPHIPADRSTFYRACTRTAWLGVLNQPDMTNDFKQAFYIRSMWGKNSSRWMAEHFGACKNGVRHMTYMGDPPPKGRRSIASRGKGTLIDYLRWCEKAEPGYLLWWALNGATQVYPSPLFGRDKAAIEARHHEIVHAFGSARSAVHYRSKVARRAIADAVVKRLRERINYEEGQLR